MSVLSNFQGLSKMEFYHNAIEIRREVTEWMLRDFGYSRNAKSIRLVIREIEPQDQATVDGIFAKYGRSLNKEFETVYPDWFVDSEREVILNILADMIQYITTANSVYATKDFEFDLRRKYQDLAITCCFRLYQELQYIRQVFKIDLNKWRPLFEKLDKEIDLLKGWRQADNKRRKK